MSTAHAPNDTPLAAAWQRLRGAFLAAFLFGCLVNLLMLTGPLFMLQVYDRVLASRSVPTLVVLVVITAVLYAFLGLFDLLRARVLSRLAHALDAGVQQPVLSRWLEQGASGARAVGRPLSDLAVLRGFIASPVCTALMDLPWVPLYLAMVFALHVQLGLLAAGGAAIAIALAVLTEALTRRPLAAAQAAEHRDTAFAEQARRQVEPVLAMGMVSAVVSHWQRLHDGAAAQAQRATERVEGLSAASRAFRLLLQSLILGLGAWLAIRHELSAGAIIAASIIAGRALAPLDQLIGGWRTVVRAQEARRALVRHLDAPTEASAAPAALQLPPPRGRVAVQQLVKRAPDARAGDGRRPILEGLNFALEPGAGLGVIGPSACGKTSLARLLTGIWRPDVGAVRLDGASFEHWSREALGRHIGYLPQQAALLEGTLAQNIARFDPEAGDEEIIAAARLAGVHEMILRLPQGYATAVGPAGESLLTGGQLQRVALARAVFRGPALVVLDEPNSNLDAEGDAALGQAIAALREAGSTVVVMAHRPSAIAAVDQILMLEEGRQTAFGPKAEVLRRFTRAASA